VTGPLVVLAVVSEASTGQRGSAEAIVAPLSDGAAAELVERLLARPNLPPDAIAAIVAACRGIPLAVEHLVAMLADDGHLRWEYGRWAPSVDLASLPLPADLRALVARRVGGLRDGERRVAATAAVARGVDVDAIAEALELPADDTGRVVASLIDRGVLRRDRDDRIAFGHDLIADVAAAYVERDAARIVHRLTAEAMADRRLPGPDVDEEIGAHLERSFRAGADDEREALGRCAADRLVAAARGASDVGDEDASLALLRRAASTVPVHDPARARLLLDSAAMLAARDERGPAERLLGDAVRAARAADDELLEHRATLARARLLATASRIGHQIESLRDAAEHAIAAASAAHDDTTLAEGWSARGWVHEIRGHFAGAADAFERAAAVAGSAGRRRDELAALADLARAIVDGPAPVDEAIERCAAIQERARGTSVGPAIASALAVLLARSGRHDDARTLIAPLLEAHATDAQGVTVRTRAASVELHAGEPERAEAILRTALDADAPSAVIGSAHAWLAYALAERDRLRDAVDAADVAARLADEDDVVTQVTWRAAKARCLAAEGHDREARALVRLALRLADQTDLSELRSRTRLDLAEALLVSGRANEAGPAARSALRALERKGSVAESRRAHSILDRIAGRAATPTDEAPNGPKAETGIELPPNAAGTADESAATPDTSASTQEEAPSSPPLGSSSEEGAAEAPAERPDEGGKRERHWFW
jgi:tetratricopeptide (TPR) repeat protein